jgi:hypothetical protein
MTVVVVAVEDDVTKGRERESSTSTDATETRESFSVGRRGVDDNEEEEQGGI